uniref:J domain-containing protein n=1 Tax=Strongyloides papillosus TaxID=174720 RepID=A0A0N5C008_STREA
MFLQLKQISRSLLAHHKQIITSTKYTLKSFPQTLSVRQLATQIPKPKTGLYDGLTSGQRKTIGVWLLGCAGMVYGAVALGGLTRLTESGLSMVQWDLIKTMKPPLTQKEWEEEFARYKQFPEYKYKTSTEEMTLKEFKFIFYMEYFHRMWGRAIGIAFLVPCAYFWARGRFTRPMKIRMAVSSALLLAQGGIGWWMVKSGLDPSNNSNKDIPRVSQYRLATHLGMAFLLFSEFLWTGLNFVLKPVDHSNVPKLGRFIGLAHSSKALVFVTAMVGALVAGLDAGLVYNSWPKFADRWIPENMLSQSPQWKNFTENPVTVQFIHRNMAYLTLIVITATWMVSRKMPLPPRTKMAVNGLILMGYTQAALGILTLIHFVPVWLAACHQSGSMALLSFSLWLAKSTNSRYSRILFFRNKNCWKCNLDTEDLTFCKNCNIIQKPEENLCPFQRLEIKKSFNIPENELKTNLRQLQSKVHPDKFGCKSEEEKMLSDKHSALLNDAFKTIQDPILRAEYLLGNSTTKEDDMATNNELLMEMMSLNEEISEIKDDKLLHDKKDLMEKEQNSIIDNLKKAFQNNDVNEAKKLVTRLKFITSARNHILKRLNLD